MKILFHTTSKQEADNVKYSLEASGVPIFIANESSGPALGYINADRYTVWVYLDEQHDDAASFLQNEDNQITSPVDVDEFYRFLDKEKTASANRWMDRMMFGAFVLACVGFVSWAAMRIASL